MSKPAVAERVGSGAPDSLMDAHEVAALLGMGVDWVYRETRAGRVPHIRLGRYCRYRRGSIERWITELEAARVAPRINRRGAAGTAPAMAPKG